MIHPPDDRVQFWPLSLWKRDGDAQTRLFTNRDGWRADAMAGLTVAIFAVPQAMAYAMMAGLPPVRGLYAAVAMSVVAALWGASPWINAGPTNSAALLAASATTPFVAQNAGGAVTLISTFALLVGLFRLLLGILRFGWMMRFVPEPAILGFGIGAGLLIGLEQMHQLLGVAASQHHHFAARLWDVLSRAADTNPSAVLLSFGTCTFMVLCERWSKKFPVALLAMVLATVLAQFLHPTVKLVREIAPIPRGLPAFQAPSGELAVWAALWPAALAAALIGLIEAVSIGQTLTLKHRRELNFNQEFFGQGLGQIAGALVGGPPGSGSFSRSALIESSGGQTRWANVFFGLFTALALAIFPRGLELIPLPALAGLLLFTGYKLIDLGAVRHVWRTSRGDAAVLFITLAVTVFWRIEYGFFAGVIVAMAIFLYRVRDLQLLELVPRVSGRFEEKLYAEGSRHEPSDVVALALHGDLFFGLAHELRAQLNEIAREQKPKFIIVRTRRAHSIDYSCWRALLDFAQAFSQNGGRLYLTGLRADLRDVIEDADMQNVLPDEQLVMQSASAWRAFEEGLARIAARLPSDANLSPTWREQFEHIKALTVENVE